jgi:cytochrome c oxidase subunit 1
MRVFSTDHKVIGLQYAVTSLLFLFIGFLLILLVRWHLAWPTAPVPVVGALLGETQASSGILLPEFYNQLGGMHGTIMVFLAVVPLLVGAFGNYLVPLMIGAADMAFPRLNMWSYWLYLAGGVVMLAGFVLPGGAASSGWTSYPPLAVLAADGQTVWLAGMVLIISSSLVGSINLIVTIVQLREPGLGWMQLPFFIWAQLVTSFLLLLAFPPLEGAAVLQLMDRLAGTSFFLPSGLVVSGEPLAVSGGGSPILWQHLFWFLAHPEVYVLILPALGIVATVIQTFTSKPLWGYRAMVGASLFMGVMSFLVWAHHMFLTGMGPTMSGFFQVTTMIISVPSVVILSALLLSLYGGSIRFSVPALFALAFLPMFGIGGLTGLPLGLAATDMPLHDTYYVIGHFHYVVAPGTLFAIFAGIYYWYPRVTGRALDERLGRWHFWGSLAAMNLVFLPMFAQGLAGMNRRLYDGGRAYAYFGDVGWLMPIQAWAAVGLGAVQLVFVWNLARSLRRGAPAADDPWRSAGREWAPGAAHDAQPDYTAAIRPDTGASNGALGFWLFIASEVMLFGALFSAYALLRVSAGDAWPAARSVLSVPFGLWHTVVLAIVTAASWRAQRRDGAGARPALVLSSLFGVVFLVSKAIEYRGEIAAGLVPAASTFLAVYFTLTGLHAVHVVSGLIANGWAWRGATRLPPAITAGRLQAIARYWVFVDAVWAIILGLVYLT